MVRRHRMKIHQKENNKSHQVSVQHQNKKIQYYDNNTVAPGEPIRLELADAFFHFCYHPERKEHIKIDTPARLEADVKYVVKVSNCHWVMKEMLQ